LALAHPEAPDDTHVNVHYILIPVVPHLYGWHSEWGVYGQLQLYYLF
jgi:hypothetical protein